MRQAQEGLRGEGSRRAAPAAAQGPAWLGATRDRLAFLRGFLRHPVQVSSVLPSGARLERRLVRCTRVDRARLVLELGPGTGGTTRALLSAMRADARLLAIEIDPGFYARLRHRLCDPRCDVHLGSAEDIEAILSAYGLSAPDVIVSGIPFSTLPRRAADGIAAAIARVLAPGGRFVAYQVRAAVAQYATPYLGAAQHEWEWLNLPPGRVFTWTKGGPPGR